MTTDNRTMVLVSNFQSEAQAADTVRKLLDEKLIACANIMAPCRSLYVWQGAMCDDHETPVWLKTSAKVAPKAVERLVELHPYDVPEVLVIDPNAVHKPYQEWVEQQVTRR